jgi:glycosyltransferase involved in cell wall biosynthesis
VPVAYSFAKPVVATSVGGLPEVVENGKTGLVVPPRDERALAEAIVTLLLSSDLSREMGIAGLIRQEREWSPERVAEQTLDVYELAMRVRPRELVGAA